MNEINKINEKKYNHNLIRIDRNRKIIRKLIKNNKFLVQENRKLLEENKEYLLEQFENLQQEIQMISLLIYDNDKTMEEIGIGSSHALEIEQSVPFSSIMDKKEHEHEFLS